MKTKFIFLAFSCSIMLLSLSSCSHPKLLLSSQSATFIVENTTPTINASLTSIGISSPTGSLPSATSLPNQSTITSTRAPTATKKPTLTLFAPKLPTAAASPTITPTFDAYHLVTATRSPAEVCPQKNPSVQPPDFNAITRSTPAPHHLQNDYLVYFNKGGIAENLPESRRPEYSVDLTNDGVPEYIFQQGDVFILGCKSGKYQLLYDARVDEGNGANWIYEIRDANQNGKPEIILNKKQSGDSIDYDVIEWDGNKFRSLLIPNDRNITKYGVYEAGKSTQLKFSDLDGDPIFELAVRISPPYITEEYTLGFPWRIKTDYYQWNGSAYGYTEEVYDPPLFRFQAVNDGDWAFLRGEYDQAIFFYQQAIKDDNLYWYSEQRRDYLLAIDPGTLSHNVTPVYPVYNPDEYPNLAAYSYFRMMLAELKKGYPSHAQTIYDWLKANFNEGMPGHVYFELADIFWAEYQKTGDFNSSCSATYEFSRTHPEEIFRSLTTQIVSHKKLITWPNPIHFGSQSAELEYSPTMICPSQ